MSLLNDALRAAEARQQRPDVPAAYGGGAAGLPQERRWVMPVMVVLLLLLLLALGYVLFVRDSDQASVAVAGRPSEPHVPNAAPAPAPAPEPKPESKPEKAPAEKPERQAAPEPAPVAGPATTASSVSIEPDPEPVSEPVSEPVMAENAADQPLPASATPAPAVNVKQVRETPEAIDLRVSQQLSELLRAGRAAAAERTLTELASEQPAVASREVFARQMLVQGMPERALDWLPESLTGAEPDLRLLRARALLASGSLERAVATLEQEVPPVSENIQYRVTLATLQQQAGNSLEAARHWSSLIALDDSRAAWWVGLAIALETRGELAGAVKAYGQAALLPGLPPSLADYVRERLKRQRAG